MIKKIAILCSIFLNLCIVRWEPVAIRMTWEAVGSQTFTFYTENSNVFAFFVCLLVAVCQVICLFTGRQLPRWVKTLKYIATCCLTMTFLTVVFVLGPYCADQGGVVFLLTESSMLYHHLLNPLCVALFQIHANLVGSFHLEFFHSGFCLGNNNFVVAGHSVNTPLVFLFQKFLLRLCYYYRRCQ